MNEKWMALAARIADLKARVVVLARERTVLQHQLDLATATYDELLDHATKLKEERDQYRAALDEQKGILQ